MTPRTADDDVIDIEEISDNGNAALTLRIVNLLEEYGAELLKNAFFDFLTNLEGRILLNWLISMNLLSLSNIQLSSNESRKKYYKENLQDVSLANLIDESKKSQAFLSQLSPQVFNDFSYLHLEGVATEAQASRICYHLITQIMRMNYISQCLDGIFLDLDTYEKLFDDFFKSKANQIKTFFLNFILEEEPSINADDNFIIELLPRIRDCLSNLLVDPSEFVQQAVDTFGGDLSLRRRVMNVYAQDLLSQQRAVFERVERVNVGSVAEQGVFSPQAKRSTDDQDAGPRKKLKPKKKVAFGGSEIREFVVERSPAP